MLIFAILSFKNNYLPTHFCPVKSSRALQTSTHSQQIYVSSFPLTPRLLTITHQNTLYKISTDFHIASLPHLVTKMVQAYRPERLLP